MTDAPPLPHGHALSWGIAEAPQRGPRREMSVERIVDAAIELADAEGMHAVSMHRVAAALGYTPMSLYRYVSSKDDLVLLMIDVASESPMILTGDTWRARTAEWARFVRAVYEAHPWLADATMGHAPSTPNRLHALDAGVRALEGAAMSDAERIRTAMLILDYAALDARAAHAVPVDDAVQSALPTLITSDRFPTLGAIIGADTFDAGADDERFGFSLERLLDGVHAWAAAGTPADASASMPASVLHDKSVKQAARDVADAERRLRDVQASARKAIDAAVERETLAAAKAADRQAARAARAQAKAERAARKGKRGDESAAED